MRVSDLLAAFMLLTRLPVARFHDAGEPPDLARAVWAFPIVGAVVGGLGGLVYWLGCRLGLPPFLAACWSFAAMLCVSGALHEDGLADTADGLGGGSGPSRALEIMRDSRIGAYGALALLVSAFMRISAVAALNHPSLAVPAMIAAGAMGRGGVLVPLLAARPARQDGMAASLGAIPGWSAALGLGLAGAVALAVLPMPVAALAGLLGLAASLAMTKLASIRIGGFTGDVLGACAVACECVVLSVAAGYSGL